MHNFKDFQWHSKDFCHLINLPDKDWLKLYLDKLHSPFLSISTELLIIIIRGKFKNLKRPFLSQLYFPHELCLSRSDKFPGSTGKVEPFCLLQTPLLVKNRNEKQPQHLPGLIFHPHYQKKDHLDNISSCCVSNGRPAVCHA